MKFNRFGTITGLLASMLVLPVLSSAAPKECVEGKPTAASYTWDFKSEATNLLNGIQQDASNGRDHAALLQSFANDPDLSWQSHAYQLTDLKADINDMSSKLCRLETIRRVVAPWQQNAIDRAATMVRLMADNTEDAITYLNHNEGAFWTPTYRMYANNLYNESNQLSNQVKQFEQYATAHNQEVHLQKDLGMKTGS